MTVSQEGSARPVEVIEALFGAEVAADDRSRRGGLFGPSRPRPAPDRVDPLHMPALRARPWPRRRAPAVSSPRRDRDRGALQALRRHAGRRRPQLAGRAGEVMGFLGPNGSGKTTTIRLLMGLLRPSAGRAAILGRDCHADAVALKRDVGYLPDEPFLYPYLTGVETLELVAGLHGFAPAEARRRADAAAERLGPRRGRPRLHRHVLAGHEEAAGAGAGAGSRAAGADPRRADQWPGSGRRAPDAGGHRRYAAGGRTIFLSTHLLDAAERLCHRVAILQRGRLQAVATPTELRARFGAGPERRWKSCSCG